MRNRTIIIALMGFLLLSGLCVGNLHAMPPAQKITTPNSVAVILSEEHSLPFVTLKLLLEAGSSKDPPGEGGLSFITARALLLGTQQRTATQINEELDSLGIVLDASPGRDFIVLNLRVLKKDLDKGIQLLFEVLLRPTFPEDEVRREIVKTMAEIQAEEDDPGSVGEKAFRKALFNDSPYGHPVEGTRESLARLTRDSVQRFYSTHYSPEKAIIAVVGDIGIDEVRTKILPCIGTWQARSVPQVPYKASYEKGPKTITIDRQITQANIIMGHKGVSRGNPDYYALSVMNYILGSGMFSSRLMKEIRDKRGLAYSVGSLFEAGKHPGSFQVILQTKNTSAREAISLAIKEIERIRSGPVSGKELEEARKYLIGSFPLRLDSQARLAGFFIQTEYYGLGLDYPQKYPVLIGSVSAEDVLRVAKKYLHPESIITVIVGNIKAVSPDSSQESRP